MTDDLIADPRPNTVFALLGPGNGWGPAPTGWYAATDLFTGSPEWAAHIYPRITDAPLTANITTNSPVCEGDFLDFDASGSTNAVSWDWAINGTANNYPTGSMPSVIMNQTGSHWAYMQIFNYCGFSLIDSVQVQVDPTPNLTVTASVDTICPGNSADLDATGATTYLWNPGGLSGPSHTVTPSSTTTYTVTGTSGVCESQGDITIVVDDNPPVAMFTMSDDTVCVNGYPLDLNGGVSANAASWSWTFTGGDITTANVTNPSVNYSTPGTYTFDLTVENTCSQTDTETGTIVVVDMNDCSYGSIGEENGLGTVSYIDNFNEIIYIQFANAINDQVSFELVSITGQIVYRENVGAIGESQVIEIPTYELQPAIYFLRITSENKQDVEKFFVK